MNIQTRAHLLFGKGPFSIPLEFVKMMAVIWLLAASPITGFAASMAERNVTETPCNIPGAQAPCIEIVQHLPWNLTPQSQETADGVMVRYTGDGSTDTMQKIRLTLEAVNHGSSENAEAALLNRHAESDPDIGISYAWDFALVRGAYLYFLHAECSLAEIHAMSVIEKLQHILVDDANNDSTGPAFLCRCGNPCRMVR